MIRRVWYAIEGIIKKPKSMPLAQALNVLRFVVRCIAVHGMALLALDRVSGLAGARACGAH